MAALTTSYGPPLSARIVRQGVVTGAAADSIILNGLAGETDKIWYGVAYFKNASASNRTIQIRPNGLTTNMSEERLLGNSGAASATYQAALPWELGDMNASASSFMQFAIKANFTGGHRRFYHSFAAAHIPGTSGQNFFWTGVWNETSTEITSLEFVSTAAGTIDVGSWVTIWTISGLAP